MSKEAEAQQKLSRMKEIRQILALLEATARIIETSVAITDQFSDGEERCARQFNNTLARLSDLEAVPDGLFEPLATDAAFGDICFACHQVTAYVKESFKEDFVDFTQIKKTIGDELKDVREVVRQSMPSFLKDVWGGQTSEDDTEGAETVEVTSDETDGTSVEQRIAKLEAQMGTVVEILQEIRAQQIEKNSEL